MRPEGGGSVIAARFLFSISLCDVLRQIIAEVIGIRVLLAEQNVTDVIRERIASCSDRAHFCF